MKKPGKKIIFPTRIALILFLPSLLLYVFFNIWPMVFSIGIAFTNATRQNILPNPERVRDLQNAIACAEFLKTSSMHRERAHVLSASILSNLNVVKSALANISAIIESKSVEESYTELDYYVSSLSRATRNLARIRPDIGSVFDCTGLGYETNREVVPKEVLDNIDGLTMLASLLANYRALTTENMYSYVQTGLNITNELEVRFKKLEEDYEGYLEFFKISARRELDELELKFVGLENFSELLNDPRFYNSLLKTLLFTAISVPMKVLAGVLLAFLYSTPLIYGKRALRALLLVPWATPFLLSALTWKFLFLPNGQLGTLLGLNVNTREWDAFTVYCIFETWLAYPFIMTITQGALSGVSKDIIEASYIDGASLWTRMRKVVFPQIARPVILATILTTGASLQAFMIPLVINGGGPIGEIKVPFIGSSVGWKNEMLILFGYNRIMIDNEYGYAASMYLIVLLIIITYVTLWFTVSRRFSR